jgi:hypothetical protein
VSGLGGPPERGAGRARTFEPRSRHRPCGLPPPKLTTTLPTPPPPASRRRQLDYAATLSGPAPTGPGLPVVDASDVEAIVAAWSGVPVERLSEDEATKLSTLVGAESGGGGGGVCMYVGCRGSIAQSLQAAKSRPSPHPHPTQAASLGTRVIGQPDAIETVASALARARCGLRCGGARGWGPGAQALLCTAEARSEPQIARHAPGTRHTLSPPPPPAPPSVRTSSHPTHQKGPRAPDRVAAVCGPHRRRQDRARARPGGPLLRQPGDRGRRAWVDGWEWG